MFGARERALYSNSLVSILKSCEGRQTKINLRNETIINGRIESVQPDMNLIMSNAIVTTLSGTKQHYKEITIRGNNIRFVEVPDSIDMINALQNQINRYSRNPNINKNMNKRR